MSCHHLTNKLHPCAMIQRYSNPRLMHTMSLRLYIITKTCLLASKRIKYNQIWQLLSLNTLTCRPSWATGMTPNNCTWIVVTSWHLCSTFWGPKKHGQKSTKKHEVPLMVFIENQTITFLTLKMKTFTMVYIISICFSQSKATYETTFMRFSYAKYGYFHYKPHFILYQIAQWFYSKHPL